GDSAAPGRWANKGGGPHGNRRVLARSEPEDITADSLQAWRELGVNRLSIGVQSFNDRELAAIARVHDADRARDAAAMTVASGIRTSLDLILGLPHQTEGSFTSTLNEAIQL